MANRKRKLPSYKNFKFKKSIKHPIKKPLPSVFRLFMDTLRHMWRYKRPFFGVILVSLILNIVLIKGFTATQNVPEIKNQLTQLGESSGLLLNATIAGLVVAGSNSNITEVANLYQTMFTIVYSLAFIWLFRQTFETKKFIKIKVKQPFYEGMTPIIPFILQLMIVGLQLIPMVIGVGLFGIVQSKGIAVSAIENVFWVLLMVFLSLLSLYWISASILSLIIVTLPDMTPVKAYKMSKKVVEFRRFIVMRKLFMFIILFLFLVGGLFLLSIMIIPNFAEWTWLILSSFILPMVIGSGYKLYRSLL